MLKKENRLSSDFEFNVSRKYGRYYESPLVHTYFLIPKNYQGPTKVGIVVSNKFSKKAVERNRIKRIYRKVVEENFEKINKGDLWIVIHPKIGSSSKTYEEINLDFNNLLQKASFSN
ncbi:ribonuclease P protein component [candidate division WWE3 bacterium]|uniref:Ribonuclease P protein component n=1 Tax=candidate division WWE3 bacterium TaxID=2053526 RepID=A0A7X9E6D3_UNCKA|nr:ribonuclease P protein component [candidate division WWE3 bacterium]